MGFELPPAPLPLLLLPPLLPLLLLSSSAGSSLSFRNSTIVAAFQLSMRMLLRPPLASERIRRG